MKKMFNRTVSNDFYLLISAIQKRTSKFVAILLVVFTIASACLPRYQALEYTYGNVKETIPTDYSYPDYSKLGTTTDPDFDMSDVAIEKEISSLRTADSKTFRRVDGTYVVAVYDEVVHYMKDGKYEDIDNTLAYDAKTGGFRNKANLIEVSLPGVIDAEKAVSVTFGEVGVSWKLIDSSTAAIVPSAKENASDDRMSLNDISSKATYAGVKENVSLEYILSGMTVKESIILSRYQKSFAIRFQYELTGLILSQDDSGTWDFIDATGKAVFAFDPLWMSDANGEISENVWLTVKEIGTGTYEVTINADDEWLSKATYPVTIDPSLSSNITSMNVQDTYVYSGAPTTNYCTQTYLRIAGTSSTLKYKTLIQFDLPSQLTGRVVTFANMYLKSDTKTNGRELVVYENTSSFMTPKVTWNTAPAHSSTIVDYHITGDSTTYIFDITDSVSRWSQGVAINYGFTLMDKQEYGGTNYVRSMEYSGTNSDPKIVIGYVDQSGLKDYWTYQSQSAGKAGTGYVADYTGMMTWVRGDISFETAKQSFGLTMAYNVFDRIGSKGYGSGWQTNYNMTVEYDSSYFKYCVTDSTGYKEYFSSFPGAVSAGLASELQDLSGGFGEFYGSEDGSGNILIIENDGSGITALHLFTSDYVLYNFYMNAFGVWYLNSIVSGFAQTNPLSTTILRVLNYPNRIDKVTDDTGNYIDFDYNGNGQMERATLYVRQENEGQNEVFDALEKVEYAYAWNSVVSTYTLSTASYFTDYLGDGFAATADEVINYGYDASARINQAYVTDKEKITYAFDANSRVSSISAYFDESLYSTVTYDYSFRKTEITDQDGNFVILKFDAYGHTINTTNNLGVTSAFEYLDLFKNYVFNEDDEIIGIVRYLDGTPNYQNNHQQISSSTPQTTDLNPLTNPGFEYDLASSYDQWSMVQITGSNQYERSTSTNFGTYALKISSTTSGEAYFYQTIILDQGSYTLSAQVKNMIASGNVYIEVVNMTMASPITYVAYGDTWRFTQQYFTVAADNTSVQIRLHYSGNSGSAYFDNVQVSESFTTEETQITENASFEYVSGTDIIGWNTSGTGVSRTALTFDETIFGELLGSYGVQIVGDVSTTRYVTLANDYIVDSEETGGLITVGAWAKSEGTPLTRMEGDTYDRLFRIRIETYVGASLFATKLIEFDPTVEGWQYCFGEVEITSTTDSIKVWLEYQGEGTVWFDGVQILFHPAVDHIEYDEFGRVARRLLANGTKYSYEYEVDAADRRTPSSVSKNDVEQFALESEWSELSQISIANVGTSFTYNDNGQVIATLTEGMTTSTTYVTAAFDQYINTKVDEFDNTTTYHNDIVTGLLEAISNARGQDTHYIYDDQGKLIRVESQSDYEDDYETPDTCVIYGYDELDRLERIVMGCEEEGTYYYEIHYSEDSPGRMESVSVVTASGTHKLMSYLYDDEGGFVSDRIRTQEYENKDYLTFSYEEDTNRLLGIRLYEPSQVLLRRYAYEYDLKGNVTVYTMYSAQDTIIEREFYQYDDSGQLDNVVDNDGNIIDYGYLDGTLQSISVTFDGEFLKTLYDIDANGILNGTAYYDTAGAFADLSRSYETMGLRRLNYLALATGSVGVGTTFTYEPDTVRVSVIAINIGEDATVEHAVEYGYDELGNIDSIVYKENGSTVKTVTYGYDDLNRLEWENVSGDYADFYQYDQRGNILAVLRFDSGDIPQTLSVPEYYYNDDSTIPVEIHWSGDYQPNDIYYLQLNDNWSLNGMHCVDPATGNTMACTFSLISSTLDPTETGFYYRQYHATSVAGIDLTFNIVFFVSDFNEAKTYNYSSGWLDQLESYAIMNSGGTTVYSFDTYDESGNPLTQTNFVYKGVTYHHADFFWDGRQLSSIKVWEDAGETGTPHAQLDYLYNDQGYRIKKTITEEDVVETWSYDLAGAAVLRETYILIEDGNPPVTHETFYLRDADGTLTGYVRDDTPYYYLKDLQGNILAVIEEDGTELIEYEYDPYGNILSLTSWDNFLANPYTYRGYRYDSEIGMYYLNSRYYSPVLSRFLNADGLLGDVGDILSTNMYAYCENDPIGNIDPEGDFLLEVLLVALVVLVTYALIPETRQVIDPIFDSISVSGSAGNGSAVDVAGLGIGAGVGMNGFSCSISGCTQTTNETTIDTPIYSYYSQTEGDHTYSSSAWGFGPIKYETGGKDPGLHLKFDFKVGNGNMMAGVEVDWNVSTFISGYKELFRRWFE